MSGFLFTVCQVEAEPALKREIGRNHPELRFAYSRPGFVTFKSPAPLPPNWALHSVFARAYGLSIGKVDPQESGPVWEKFRQEVEARGLNPPFRLHVWTRDRFPPGEEPPAPMESERLALAELEKTLRASAPEGFLHSATTAEEKDTVLDVIALEPDQADAPLWLGIHEHTLGHSPFPGGKPSIPLPAQAPSRAYLKLEQALQWSKLPLRAGDMAVEIGSAPGGAVYALLQRGLSVVGIDSGEMDPVVFKGGPSGARFQHLRRSVSAVNRSALPPAVHWLLLDMNTEPLIALSAAERLARELSGSLLGVVFTIKLNRWELAEEIPQFLEEVRKMGVVRLRATQLASHRREIVVTGLTRKGLLR